MMFHSEPGPPNAQAFLQFSHRVSLFSEEAEGFVVGAISSDAAQVRALVEPYTFERFVFVVEAVDDQTALEQDCSESQIVVYGQAVQLYHPASDTYLCIHKMLYADTQKNAFKVTLAPIVEASDSKLFKFIVRPQYNVRQEGDAVRLGDQVTFVAAMDDRLTGARYLHVTLASEEDEDGRFFEVNCSLTPTAWTIRLYDNMATGSGGVPSIRAGVPIFLFQKVAEGFLTADVDLHLREMELLPRANSFFGVGGESRNVSRFTSSYDRDPSAELSRVPSDSRSCYSQRRLEKEMKNRLKKFVSGFQTEEHKDVVYLHHGVGDRDAACAGEWGSDRTPSTALWIIEGRDQEKGGEVQFNRPYRLRNMATNMYLGAKKEGVEHTFLLRPEANRGDTLFIFLTLDESGCGYLKNGVSILRIQHLRTGQTLHTALQGPPSGESHISILSLSPKAFSQDVFVVQQADPQLAVKLNWVLGRKRLLQALAHKFAANGGEYPSSGFYKSMKLAMGALTDFILFCTESSEPNPLKREGPPIDAHQRLLLEQTVHKAVVQLLKCPFQPNDAGWPGVPLIELGNGAHKSLHRTCVLCYRLLKQIAAGNPQHGRQLSEHIPFMQTQLFSSLPVTDTISEIFKDNRVLLEQLTEDVLHCFLNFEKNKQSTSYLNFLCQLCVCGGVGIPNNQALIGAHVVDPANQRLLPTRLTGGGHIQVMVPATYTIIEYTDGCMMEDGPTARLKSTAAKLRNMMRLVRLSPKPGELGKSCFLHPTPSLERDVSLCPDSSCAEKWVDLSDFCRDASPAQVTYLQYSLRLLWNLCVGDNAHCKQLVQRIVPKAFILAAIGPRACHRHLPDPLKSEIYQLAAHLHVLSPASADVALHHKVIPWAAIKAPARGGGRPEPSEPAEDEFMSFLRRAALSYLKHLLPVFNTDTNSAELTRSVLETLVQMVLHRQYAVHDCEEIFSRVIPLLEATGGSDSVLSDCQRLVCRLLFVILDHHLDFCVESLLCGWKRLLRRFPEEALDDAQRRAMLGESLDEVAQTLADFSVTVASPAETYDVFKKYLHARDTPIISRLLRLTFSQDKALVDEALSLTFRLFCFNSEVCRRIFKVQLLFDKRSDGYYAVYCAQAERLQRLTMLRNEAECQQALECLTRLNERLGTIAENELQVETADLLGGIGESFRSRRTMRRMTHCNPALRSFTAVEVFSERFDSRLSSTGLLEEQQGILLNMEMHALVVRLLENGLDPEGEPYKQPLYRQAYQFLALFCYTNVRNQQALFDLNRVALFLQHIGFDVSAESCLCNMFADNAELCLQVDPEAVSVHVELVCDGSTEMDTHMRFLQVVSHVDGMAVLRSQELILAGLMECGARLPEIIHGKLDPADLRSIEGIVRLLTLCCSGVHGSLNSSLQHFLNIETLLNILADTEAPLDWSLQRHFLRYLVEGWWHTAMTEEEYETTKEWWMQHPRWWEIVQRFLDFVTRDLMDWAAGPEQADPVEVDRRVEYFIEGVVYTLTEYFQRWWQVDDFESASKGVVMKSMEAVSLVAELVKDETLVEVLDLREVHFQALERFFQAVMSSRPQDVGADWMVEAIEECRKYITDAHEDSAEEEKPEEPPISPHSKAELVVARIRTDFSSLRQAIVQKYHNDGVDDVQLMTNYVEPCLTQDLLRGLMHHLKRPTLPQYVQTALLQLFAAMIQRHIREAATRKEREALVAVQLQFNELGAVPLMVKIIEGGSEVVVQKAVEFGITLLHGGNAVVQDALLAHLERHKSLLFSKLSALLRKFTLELRQRQPALREAASSPTGSHPVPLNPSAAAGGGIGADPEPHPTSVLVAQPRAILRLLQLFCEGHHLRMQHTIRTQKSIQSFDMVTEVIAVLRELVLHEMDHELLTLLLFTFNTLTEFCQGPCEGNQTRIVSCNACNEVNQVMKLRLPADLVPALRAVKSAALIMLLSLLEGCRDRARPLLLLRTLQLDTLEGILQATLQDMERSLGTWRVLEEDDEAALDMGFNLLILLRQLLTLTKDQRIAQCLERVRMTELLTSLIGAVEISRGDVVEKVYFRKPVNAGDLTDESRQWLIRTVDRASPAAKLIDFCAKSSQIMFEMRHQTNVRLLLNARLPLPTCRKGTTPWHRLYNAAAVPALLWLRGCVIEKFPSHGIRYPENACLVLASLINLLYGLIHIHPDLVPPIDATLPREIWLAEHHYYTMLLINCLGFCLLLTTVGTLGAYLTLHLPSAFRELDVEPPEATDLHTLAWHYARLFTRLRTRMKVYYVLALLLVVACLLGLRGNPPMFCFHMLILMRRSQTVQHIVEAVSRNGKSLLLTALLGMIIVYFFTAVGYELFPRDIAGERNENCLSLFQCFIFSLTSGTRAGGGIGELLPQHTWDSPKHLLRVVYDFAFFVIVPIILLNIVFGIILDTFAQLRDEREKVEEDMHAQCFICNIPAYTFDRYLSGGFARHTATEHNLWDYFFFLQHLDGKDQDEYTGQESYVATKLQKGDVTFFPMNRALSLSGVPVTQMGSLGSKQAMSMPVDLMEPFDGPQDLSQRIDRLESRLDQVLQQLQAVAPGRRDPSFGDAGYGVQVESPGVTPPTSARMGLTQENMRRYGTGTGSPTHRNSCAFDGLNLGGDAPLSGSSHHLLPPQRPQRGERASSASPGRVRHPRHSFSALDTLLTPSPSLPMMSRGSSPRHSTFHSRRLPSIRKVSTGTDDNNPPSGRVSFKNFPKSTSEVNSPTDPDFPVTVQPISLDDLGVLQAGCEEDRLVLPGPETSLGFTSGSNSPLRRSTNTPDPVSADSFEVNRTVTDDEIERYGTNVPMVATIRQNHSVSSQGSPERERDPRRFFI